MNSHSSKYSLLAESLGQFAGVRVGKVVSVSDDGEPLVDFPGNSRGPVAARCTRSIKISTLRQAAADRHEVLLLFEDNDPRLPIILDVMHSLLNEITDVAAPLEVARPDDVLVDGKRVTLDAKDEIVLRCGKASITLTSAGKVLIRGAYILTRSTGANRIKGAVVDIN
jgi:hypothetical protein